ncbi:MAG: CopG family transcriptional regulator [Candidatus Omnitrophica bacterium]|nr:CopG family transcriptional regulator [Candidatus Omnitrophota bacterium]
MPNKKEVTITIPEDILEAVEKRIENSSFNSLSDYITFVLKEIVADDVSKNETEDDGQIKKRLEDLGYLG